MTQQLADDDLGIMYVGNAWHRPDHCERTDHGDGRWQVVRQ
jgi:hypothetical protein